MIKLTFHGAAQEVTGSMHLLSVNGYRIALDCGLFQGRRAEANAKNATYPCPPSELNAVVLSHAHMDHAGRLPRLAKDGFSGQIDATSATRDLCAVMLADSAHIQEEDAFYWNKKRVRRGELPIQPLYDQKDAVNAVKLMRTSSYNRPFEVVPGVTGSLFDAGHMLGSAGVHLLIERVGGNPISLVYTGDIGRPGMPIIRDPEPLPSCDYLITESTYGGRTTDPVEDLATRLEAVMNETLDRDGKVIIPSFSVGRTQTVLYTLQQLFQAERVRRVPVYVDSPLAVDATEVFRLHPECFDTDATAFFAETGDVLGARCCTYIHDVEQSKELHKRKKPCVIISASGMCEFGRILHHLKNNIDRKRNTVLIVGYQAAHTLGRRLVEGASEVKIFGKWYPVKAKVVVLNGFSAHANREELRNVLLPLAGTCKHAFVAHGDPDQSAKLQARMTEDGYKQVTTPAPGESFELS
jgi:metallo-beta-lactamase family protein